MKRSEFFRRSAQIAAVAAVTPSVLVSSAKVSTAGSLLVGASDVTLSVSPSLGSISVKDGVLRIFTQRGWDILNCSSDKLRDAIIDGRISGASLITSTENIES